MENHTDVENGGVPEQSNNDAVSPFIIFFFQSVVAAALFPIVLGSSGGDMVVVIWRLSLLLCTYFYSAFCVLSPAAREGKARIFVCLTYAASMAFVVDTVLIHGVGTAIIYLDSVWMAGVFGHALAGGATASSSSSSERAEQHRASQEELMDDLGFIAMELVVFAALGLALVCIMDPDSAPKVAMGVLLPVPLCYFLTNAIICALKPMRGAPGTVVILGMECDTTVLRCSFILPLMIFMCSLLLVGEVGAAVVLLFCAIGLSLLLGYCHNLQASSACNTIHGWLSVRSKEILWGKQRTNSYDST